MYYAQLTDGIVTAVSETAGEIVSPDMIQLAGFNPTLLGKKYEDGAFTDVTVPAATDPCEWLIDLGPFYDRFGAARMAVLTSTDAGVKAIVADVSIRKWIDLQRPDVATSLSYIGSVVSSVTPALQTAILTTPVQAEENRALRKLYFA